MMRGLTLAGGLVLVSLCAACTSSGGTSGSLQMAAKYNAQIASNYMRQGRMQLARSKLAEALKQAPHSAVVHNTLALYYIHLRLYDKAEKQYRLSLQYKPHNPQTMNNFGVFLCSHGKPRKSLQYFVKAAGNLDYSTPDSAFANAGLCALKIPDKTLAQKYFRRALAINPNQRQALWHMGLMAFKKGRYSSAYRYLGRLIEGHARPTARALWVGLETAWIIGKRDEAQRMGRKLLKLYPHSKEAGKFIKLIGHAQ